MIPRLAANQVEAALARQAAVALIGPRQVGKATLAHVIAETRPSLYLDLESQADRARLSDPALFLKNHEDKLVILDEIHRVAELFETLRGLIDQGRRKGKRTGRFLVLGSTSIDLLRQSGERLAGRIEYVDLGPLSVLEVGDTDRDRLWLRGGFPDSYLAKNDADSLSLRRHGLWAIEIKGGLAPKVERGFHNALEDLRPKKAFVVYSGDERYPIAKGIEAIPLRDLATELAGL
jgi:predicted AAA+ superfamily ATPase